MNAHKLATENDQRINRQDLLNETTEEKIYQTAKDIYLVHPSNLLRSGVAVIQLYLV